MLARTAPLRLTLCCLLALLAGCTSARTAKYTGIEAWPYLRINPADRDGGHEPYRYVIPTDWRPYKKLMLDPVVIYRGDDNQFDGMAEEDKRLLADYMQRSVAAKLASRFEFSDQKASDTLRIRLTLTGAQATTPVVGQLAHLDIAGNAYDAVQSVRGRQGAFAGYVIYAVEIRDSVSNRLIEAHIYKQYPDAMNFTTPFSPLAAAQAGIDQGAGELAARFQ